jgi:alpha-N-acetylglucosamine transferase
MHKQVQIDDSNIVTSVRVSNVFAEEEGDWISVESEFSLTELTKCYFVDGELTLRPKIDYLFTPENAYTFLNIPANTYLHIEDMHGIELYNKKYIEFTDSESLMFLDSGTYLITLTPEKPYLVLTLEVKIP